MTLGFGALPAGVTAGATVTAAVALTDDDPLTVELGGPAGTVSGAFEVTVTFSESVTGFEAGDLTVVGGTATLSGSDAEYVAAVTPSGSGTVTVDVAAGVAQDDAGNGNEASERLTVTVQLDCASGVAVADPGNSAGLVADCRALLAAKAELAGTGSLNWSADAAVSSWDGVTTGGAPGRVTELRLAGRALTGTVPAGLSALSSLTALDLSNNEVSGKFPSALGSLSALRVLKVRQTRLSGCVPEALRARLDRTRSDLGDLRYCDQGPGRPPRPTVRGLGSSVVVAAWTPPDSRAAITDYDVRYRVVGDDDFIDANHAGVAILATIVGLLPGRSYEVQVRATSADGSGAWSKSGVTRTEALTIDYGAGSYAAVEGGAAAAVTVRLSAAAAEELSIPITVSAADGTETGDYTTSGLSAGALAFAVGESSKAFTVAANQDADSADESVTLGFGALPAGVTTGATVSAVVALSDDDPLTVELSGPSGTVSGPFAVTVTFSEPVTRFEAGDLTVVGATLTLSGSVAEYAATVSPSGSGTVTVDVAAGVAQDDAGNGNEASERLTVTVQLDCASGVAVADPGNSAGLVADCRALLAAKAELAGTGSLNWSADAAVSSWDGVTTGGAPGRVTELRLAGRALTGTVPAGLSALSSLTALDLSNNEVSGKFPSALGSLSALRVLKVRQTRLSGCVPEALRARLDRTRSDLGDLRYCDQGPGRPPRPTVRGLGSSVVVAAWTPPDSRAAITDYDVRYRVVGDDDFIDANHAGVAILATIVGLLPGRSYEVQVRATSADGSGAWSKSGVTRTEALTIDYGAGSYAAVEGGAAAAVTVRLSAAAAEELSIPITVSAADGTETGDYTTSGLSAGALAFAVGESSKAFTVAANQDADSADESVTLGFGALPAGVTAGATVTAAVALTDDDPLTVELGGPAGTVSGAFEVTVTFSESVTGFEAGDLTVVGGTATLSGSDAEYVATVTPSGSGTVTVDVAAGVAQDDAGHGSAAAEPFSVTVRLGCASGTAVADPASNARLVRDCETLLAAKAELAGTGSLNWSADAAITSWDGVKIGGAPKRVTRLELRNRQLTGSVPAALGRLGRLLRLDLAHNRLRGSIPSELGGLRNLARLYLHANDLSGSIPGELGKLSKLRRLWLSANGLTGAVPGALGKLTDLRELYLQENPLSGCVPSALGSIAGGKRNFGELRLCGDGPARPSPPVVTAAGPDSVRVAWSAPAATGVTIDGYAVRHREKDAAAFAAETTSATATATTITGLLPGRTYEVQVRANSGRRAGPWSPSGFGRTGSLMVTFGPGPFTAVEGGAAATVVVALSAAAPEETGIPITATAVGAAQTGDYEVGGLSGGAVTFAVGAQTRTITVTAVEDDDSTDEAVLLTFGMLPRSVSEGTLTSARVTLADNDTAPLTVRFEAPAYAAVEGKAAVTIPVRLSQAAPREVRVPVTVTPRGTAAAGDYAVGGLTAGMLVFAAGEDTAYVTVAAVDDTDAADEAVVLGFGAGVPAGAVATAEVTLEDDDPAPLTAAFGAASYAAVEGGAAVSVTVALSQEPLTALAVPITVTGQGTTAAEDYAVSGLSAAGALHFGRGERQKTFTVKAVADADSADEAVVLGFGAGLPAGATPRAVVTLQDDDGEGVSFGAARYRVAEGGALTVAVKLLPAPAAAVTIPLAVTARGSTAAGDYRVIGLSGSNALTFAAGIDERSFYLIAAPDADAEDETLEVRFGTLPAGVSRGVVDAAAVTIVDDESTAPRVSFIGASYPATEGGAAVAVTVSLQPRAAAALAVPITVTAAGTTASGDYTVSGLGGGALTIAAGQATGVFTIAANEDADAADEVVELGFGTLPAGTSAGVQATSRVLLDDDDDSALAVSYGAAGYAAAEGSTAVAVTVHLSQAAPGAVAVPITVTPRGTAQASDYAVGGLNAHGALTFAAGERTQTLTVSAEEDADAADEAVVLGFGAGTVPAGERAAAVVTLQDDDTTALHAQFGASSYTAVEGGAAAAVTVSLSQAAVAGLAVPITVTPRGTAQAGDYSVSGLNADGALAFAAGERTRTFTVTANVDADTVDEEVVLGLGGVVPAGALPVAVVRLQEGVTGSVQLAGSRAESDDRPAVSFVGSEHDVTEGAAVRITVKLGAAAAESVTVPITATPRGGTQEADYSLSGLSRSGLAAGALVFAAGDLQRTFTLQANEDADGAHETVVLGFGRLPVGVTAGNPATTTVRIEDDERPVLERITRVNRALAPHLAQAATASVIDAIGGRVAAARTGSARHAAFDTAGLERLAQALAARGRARTASGRTGALPSVEQVLGATAFALPVAGGANGGDGTVEPGSGSAPTVWGTGDYRSLGSAAGGSAPVTWSGDLFSAHLGFDAPLGDRLLGGVALSWTRGAFTYVDRQESRSAGGLHRAWTLSAHPYLSWSPAEALGLWATAGYGGGRLEVDDAAADVQSSDLRRLAAAGGLQAALSDERLLPGGTTSVTARTEGAYTWSGVAGGGLIEPLTAPVWRGRLALEGAHERALPWGSRIRPALEVGVRYDGGEGMAGAGVEVGGGLRYAEPWGLTIEGSGRMLVAHQSGYREWAAGGRLSLDLGRDRQGLSVSVAPSYGRTASGVQRLWESGAPASANAAGAAQQGRVDAELSYGVLLAGQALITPYGGVSAAGDGARRYQVGGRLDVGPAFNLTLTGEHHLSPSGAAHQKVRVRGTLRL